MTFLITGSNSYFRLDRSGIRAAFRESAMDGMHRLDRSGIRAVLESLQWTECTAEIETATATYPTSDDVVF